MGFGRGFSYKLTNEMAFEIGGWETAGGRKWFENREFGKIARAKCISRPGGHYGRVKISTTKTTLTHNTNKYKILITYFLITLL